MWKETHLSTAVNEFCQCLRISIKQRGEQWATGLGAVRDSLCVTRQCETASYMTSLLSFSLPHSFSDSHFQASYLLSSPALSFFKLLWTNKAEHNAESKSTYECLGFLPKPSSHGFIDYIDRNAAWAS